jgi:hypothetical protein
MTRIRSRGFVVLVGAVTAWSLIYPNRAGAQDGRPPTPVTIVAPVPVPVSGSLALAGEATVKVTNPATQPVPIRDVDRGVREPFTHTFAVSSNACNCRNCCFPTVAVPSGKRMVIQHVSGYFTLEAPGNMGPVTLLQVDPGPPSSVATILTLPVSFREQWNGGNLPAYEFGQQVLGYVNAGTSLQLSIYAGSFWSFFGGQVTCTGYLESVP